MWTTSRMGKGIKLAPRPRALSTGRQRVLSPLQDGDYPAATLFGAPLVAALGESRTLQTQRVQSAPDSDGRGGRRGGWREAHLPTQQPTPGEEARLPRPDGHSRRTGRAQ